MSVKESKSLQFNGLSWRVSRLGETAILLESDTSTAIEKIHQSTKVIIDTLGEQLSDVVPAYHSIAVFIEMPVHELCNVLQQAKLVGTNTIEGENILEIPICYEEGLDLDRLIKHTKLAKEELITTHLNGVYRSLFIGFTPGFVYADGLDETLQCPRLENPRTKVFAGSIGIAGNQTGIYSLASPGGWNIIGRTPRKIFDPNRKEAMLIDVGMKYKFYRITQKEFFSWEN